MAKRPYSMKYTARANPRRYLLSGIPPTLWEKVRKQARREHVAVRQVILQALEEWLADAPCREEAQERERRAPEQARQVQEAEGTRRWRESLELDGWQPVWTIEGVGGHLLVYYAKREDDHYLVINPASPSGTVMTYPLDFYEAWVGSTPEEAVDKFQARVMATR